MAECDLEGKGARICSVLMLLGWEAPPALRVSVGPDMFVKPNKCAFENITYFLFCKLNPVLAKERFRLCMPIVDKKMEQNFRKTCSLWLREISEEKQSCGFPLVQHSLFISPGGNLFTNVMYHFCIYVLEKQILKSKNVGEYRSRLLPPAMMKVRLNGMEDVVAERLMADTALLRRKMLQRVHHMQVDIEESWNNSRSQDKEYKELTVQIQKQEKKMDSAVKACGYALVNEEGNAAVEECLARKTEENKTMLAEVRAKWATLNGTLEALRPSMAAVDAVLSGEADRYRLDGAAVDVKIPQLLLTLYKKDIKRQRVQNVIVAGRLDIVSLLHLHRLALRHYMDELRNMGLPDLANTARDLHGQAASLATCRAEMKTLRLTIVGGVLPDLNKAVAELDARWQERQKGFKGFNSLKELAFYLPPEFPPLSLEPLEQLEEDSEENVPSLFPYPLMDKQIDCSAKPGSHQAEVDFPLSSGLITPRAPYPSLLNLTEKSVGASSRAPQRGLRYMPCPTMTAQKERPRRGETKLRRPGWKSQAKDFDLEADKTMERAHEKLAEQITATVVTERFVSRYGSTFKMAEVVTLGVVGHGAYFTLEGAEDPATTMLSNPFTTKSELQRTPVQIVSDVRVPWREDTDGQLSDETPDSYTDADENKQTPIPEKKGDNILIELGQKGDRHTEFTAYGVSSPQRSLSNTYGRRSAISKRMNASNGDAEVNGSNSLFLENFSTQSKKNQPLHFPLHKLDDSIGSLRDDQDVLGCISYLQDKETSCRWKCNQQVNAVGNQDSTKSVEYLTKHKVQEDLTTESSHPQTIDCNNSSQLNLLSPFPTTTDRLNTLFQKPSDKSVDYSPIRSPMLIYQTTFPGLFSESACNNSSFSPLFVNTNTITPTKLPFEKEKITLKSTSLDFIWDLMKSEMDRQILPKVRKQPEADGCTKASTTSLNPSNNCHNRWSDLGKETYNTDDAGQFGILNETMPVLGDSHSSPGSLCATDSMEDDGEMVMVAAATLPSRADNHGGDGDHSKWQDDTSWLSEEFASKQVPASGSKKAITDEMEAINEEPRQSELHVKSGKKAFCLDYDFLNSFALENQELALVHEGRLSEELAITPNLLGQLDLDFTLPQIYLDRFAGKQ